jgi:hypothetical protein
VKALSLRRLFAMNAIVEKGLHIDEMSNPRCTTSCTFIICLNPACCAN